MVDTIVTHGVMHGPIYRHPCRGHCGSHCLNHVTDSREHVWIVPDSDDPLFEACEFEGCGSCF